MTLDQLFSRYRGIIPDYEQFLEVLQRPLPVSFRINTLKCDVDSARALLSPLDYHSLPFGVHSYILDTPTSIGNHPAHALGIVYGQEAASLVPALALEPQPHETVLDLCAAPGSKSTQLAQMMGNTGLLVTNEVNRRRMMGLLHNLKRCGVINEVVTAVPGQRIDKHCRAMFDRVLIDAPCSAEGTIRRSRAVLYHWGLENIKRMAWIQKGLITAGFHALRPGGTMVYATCTIAPEENEAVVDYLLAREPEADVTPIQVRAFTFRPGITRWQDQDYDARVAACARILPQDNDTAPFFVARITRKGTPPEPRHGHFKMRGARAFFEELERSYGISPDRLAEHAVTQDKNAFSVSTVPAAGFRSLRAIRLGLEAGRIHEDGLRLDPDFVQLFGGAAQGRRVDLTDDEFRQYLRGGTFRRAGLSPGYLILTWKGIPVGSGRCRGDLVKSSLARDRRLNAQPQGHLD